MFALRVVLSTNARFPPPPYHCEYKHSSPALTVSFRVQPLTFHVISSATLISCPPFSITAASFRARPLVLFHHHIISSLTACVFSSPRHFPMPPMCSVERHHSCLTLLCFLGSCHHLLMPPNVFSEHYCLTACASVLPPLCTGSNTFQYIFIVAQITTTFQGDSITCKVLVQEHNMSSSIFVYH